MHRTRNGHSGHFSKRRMLQGLVSLGCAPSVAWAQFRIEVSGAGAAQIPIVIAPFRAEEGWVKPSVIIANDLQRSGVFLPASTANPLVGDETTRPDFAKWRSSAVDYALLGQVVRLADARLELRAHLWDVVKGADLGTFKQVVMARDLRFGAHRISDWVYEKLTGDKGVASSRIAYVTKSGSASDARFNLWVADADGERAVSALTSKEPIISPAWSPNGQDLAYVSFESKKPVVYIHHLPTGQRRVIADFKGSNSAPAWSPDGKTLVVTLSTDGGSQMYLIGANGGTPRRILRSGSIDTEATFSRDGRALYFVSDRGGAPQIYRMSLDGSDVQRVTFNGNYNISPALSPDGTKLAFITRQSGTFRLMVQDLGTGAVTALTDTLADESPSFSPNGQQLVYATRAQVAGQWEEFLMTTTVDGSSKSRLRVLAADIREPDWGP